MRDATIYQLYDGVHLKAAATSALGCLSGENIQSVEIREGKFIDVIPNEIVDGEISDDPGFYLLLEFDENVDEYRGIVYTIDENGCFHQGCIVKTPHVQRLVSWPPK